MLASIIITNYNYGKYLRRCITSCLNQNFGPQNFEVIVVDDKSSDDSIKIIKDFSRIKNFKFLINKRNIGVAKSANKAIAHSKGKYFIRVDADDFISKDLLKFMILYIENNIDILGVACDYVYITNEGKKLKKISSLKKPISCGILYNKKKLKTLGFYNKDFKHREEEELRVRLGSKYKIHNLPIPFYRYRIHTQNKTRSSDYKKKFKLKIQTLKVEEKIKNYNLKKNKLNIAAIIPAKINSRRLNYKNIKKIWGKPMIYWAINAAKNTKIIKNIYVSSESNKVLSLAKKYGVKTIKRPADLSKNTTPKMDVIKHAVNTISKRTKPKIIISLQANSPNLTSLDLLNGIINLVKFKKNEIISVDENLMQNAAFRIMKYKTVFQKGLSTYMGVSINKAIDIHTIKDFKKIIQ